MGSCAAAQTCESYCGLLIGHLMPRADVMQREPLAVGVDFINVCSARKVHARIKKLRMGLQMQVFCWRVFLT